MKAVIVEDEVIAAKKLQRLIAKIDSNIKIIQVLKSITDSVEWFSNNPAPDLVFMDIHLSDGSAFAIFERIKIQSPIIFTTAYDEYALKAFEVNSIDYVLKPMSKEHLERAIKKFTHFNKANIDHEAVIEKLLATLREQKVYKKSLLLQKGERYYPISVEEIAYVYLENKTTKIVTFQKEHFTETCSLEKMQEKLDPSKFFRANRQFIIAHKAIKGASMWFMSNLNVELLIDTPEKVVISRERANEFKEWYTKR